MSTIMDLGKLRFYWAGDYNAATVYESNDIVRYGGNIYVWIYGLKQSGIVPTNTTYWAKMVEGFSFDGVYDANTTYQAGDGVSHGGRVYVAVQTTQGNTPPNSTYWSVFADGIQYEAAYNNTTGYQKNDVVTYGPQVYIAKQDTTGNLPTDTVYWDKFVEGISASAVYNAATAYVPGNLVAYGGNIYQAIANTTGNLPTDTANWSLFVPSINPRGPWATSTAYEPNDLVVYGGKTFRALLAHAGGTFETDLAANRWEQFTGGIDWKGTYAAGGTFYKVGDVFQYDVSSYIVTTACTSTNFAGDAANYEQLAVGANIANVSGQAGKFLSTDGTITTWASIPPSTEQTWTIKTANYTAAVHDRVFANTSGGAWTLTHPASPTLGQWVQVNDVSGSWATNNLTIARNSSTMMGGTTDLIANVSNSSFYLVYSDSTYGWRIV